MIEPSKDFIDAWETHTGLEWAINYQGGSRDSYRDFKAGWDSAKACASQLLKIVEEQAEDEGLWFIARTAPEAYLQQGLRRLHAKIEAFRED